MSIDLTQSEADKLIAMPKRPSDDQLHQFPPPPEKSWSFHSNQLIDPKILLWTSLDHEWIFRRLRTRIVDASSLYYCASI